MRHRVSGIAVLWLASASVHAQTGAQSLNLHQAEQLGLQNNPKISSAFFTARAAGQIPTEVRANYMPQLFGSITGAGASDGTRIAAGALNNPVIYDRLASGFTASQMIADFGRTGNLVANARLKAQAADQNTETARAQVVLQVDRAYYALLRAQNVLTVAQETVKARQLVADQVTALAQSKLKSALDVSFAEVNLSEAKLLLVSAENDVKAAAADFSAALGYADQRSFILTDEPMPGPVTEDQAGLVRQALQNRPELRDLRLEESAAQRFTKAERALWFPTVSTLVSAGYVPTRLDLLSSRYSAVGLNINIPILNGGLYSARHREAELQEKAAGQNVRDMENQVARDVRVAYLNALTAWQRVGLTAQMLDQARLALDLAQSRYDIGLSSIVELSQAQLNQTSAEIASVSAKYDFETQRAMLDYEVGVNR